MLGGLQYYTGQFFELGKITEAAHEADAFAGFDLAHAIGNLPLNLHEDDVDFAVWCSYKYLNSGPGGVSGIYVNEKHGSNNTTPRLGGWWGQNEEIRFKMKKGFQPMKGADGWQLSNVNVISTAAHWASLEIFSKAGMDKIREKSKNLTGYLEFLLKDTMPGNYFEIITPSNPEERGAQLSLLFKKNGKEVFEALTKDNMVVDWREPNVVRIAPAPLYNSFSDVFTLGISLRNILNKK
jgi:kynureninase